MTFNETVASLKTRSALAAWNRACLASWLRHAAEKQGKYESVRLLGEVKAAAINRAVALAPNGFRVIRQGSLAAVRQNGLRFSHATAGLYRGLHLPAEMLA